MDQHRQVFLEEAAELLQELESALLALEETPYDMDLVSRVFRAMHTIKGSGAMFGFDEVSTFTHHVESVFDQVRSGKIPVTKELIGVTLAARDQIQQLIGTGDGESGANPADSQRIIDALRALAPTGDKDGGQAAATMARELEGEASETAPVAVWRIRFSAPRYSFASGLDLVLIFQELRGMGDAVVIARSEDIPELDALAPDECYLKWDVLIATKATAEEIRSVFIFADDGDNLVIELIDDGRSDRDFAGNLRLGEILLDKGDATSAEIKAALEEQARVPIGALLVKAGVVTPTAVEAALAEQAILKRQADERKSASVRVPADRLDKLINLVGEMVTSQARLSQVASSFDETQLASSVEEIERLTSELRDCVLNIRMLPIGTTFNNFKRLVRDLSGELGKEIDLVTDGAETELDKTVLDRLGDPLVHLLRNSIDHGIEPPDARQAAGKTRRGTIRLSAAHTGANVTISISDDGAGLNAAAIKAKALENGLIQPGEALTDSEIYRLVFSPGLSTAKRVTSVSGRGVGMDVVKREIDELRGSIDISSAPGQGTTITLALPLTLAIIDGLLVRVDTTHYVLPLAQVEECVELSTGDVAASHGRNVVNVRGRLIPYLRLRDMFRIPGERPHIEQVAIINAGGECTGFVVDEVLGGRQTVIKSLGRMYRDADGFSGATILGDGDVALIIDVLKLVRLAEREEREQEQQGR